jgi:SAM-dependent methyltransferase
MEVTCADYAPAHLAHQQALGFDTLPVDLDAAAPDVDRVAQSRAGLFDLVVSLATIEHVFDSDNFLRLCHTVLKPGGLLLVNTPNIGYIGYRLYSQFSGNRPFGEGHHVRFWDFRFLQTNLFLNGFRVVSDARGFFSLPLDPLTRAFRGHAGLAGAASRLFHLCRLFQYLPGCGGWACDELTVLAEREAAPSLGFQYMRVRPELERLRGTPAGDAAFSRLGEARRRGWLREHLMLDELARTGQVPTRTPS